MHERPDALFQQALDALYGIDQPAISQFYWTNNDPCPIILDGRACSDPKLLPPYWTLSTPRWYDPLQGTLDCSGRHYEAFTGKTLVQEWFPNPQTGVPVAEDVFDRDHPFLVFEVDYLICGKDDGKSLPPEEVARRKRIQVQAMELAFKRTGFPFAVLVHSGGKSLHAYVRLSNTREEIATFRKDYLNHLVDLAWMVFGNYDRAVLKESGRVRLVRTPGALREDGTEQKIIGVGKQVSINELFQWFYSQLSQEAVAEMQQRQPVTTGVPGVRFFSFWQDDWKRDLLVDHNQGERGTHWMFVSKKLAMAGQKRPDLRQPVSDQYDASWLWWFTAVVFNEYSRGWFFSTDVQDWSQLNERTRWWGVAEIMQHVQEQRQAKGIDQSVLQLTNSMMDQQLEQPATAVLPPVSPSTPVDPLTGQVAVDPTRDMLKEYRDEEEAESTKEEKPKKEKKEKPPKEEKPAFDPRFWADLFFDQIIKHEHLIYCGDLAGEQWWYFNGEVWVQTSSGALKSLIHKQLMPEGWLAKHRNEVFAIIEHQCYTDHAWQENKSAIAFKNGTLYIDLHTGKVEFKSDFDLDDRLRTQVQYLYDPLAKADRWRRCMERFLPDNARRALFQEMFGYTLLSGQPFQSFFLLLGTGSNFKSTAIKVLEEIHKDSREAISLAGLASDFALGTLFAKRLAIDGDADSISKRDLGDNARILSVVKAWTGGDAVKVAVKNVQGWTTPISAKLILAANKKPRFIDPTKGVWRRLKIIKFDVFISEGEAIPDYDKILVGEEMSGIITWAIEGLMRLLLQKRFSTSESLRKDLEEYQLDNDNTLQFMKEFMVKDDTAGWYDLRPIYQAYRAFAEESGSNPTALNEFKNRLDTHGCVVAQPPLSEAVHNVPQGSAPHPDHHHWAVKGYRCLHPVARLSQGLGAYPQPGIPGQDGKVIHALPMFERPR